mmetsp:Transcript_29019/g.61693  ORF Transcript_29019/g.61693 Transcript_29019/m.61693 type:complete len:84 (+) Transcript_29019:1187-1438(+)
MDGNAGLDVIAGLTGIAGIVTDVAGNAEPCAGTGGTSGTGAGACGSDIVFSVAPSLLSVTTPPSLPNISWGTECKRRVRLLLA